MFKNLCFLLSDALIYITAELAANIQDKLLRIRETIRPACVFPFNH